MAAVLKCFKIETLFSPARRVLYSVVFTVSEKKKAFCLKHLHENSLRKCRCNVLVGHITQLNRGVRFGRPELGKNIFILMSSVCKAN